MNYFNPEMSPGMAQARFWLWQTEMRAYWLLEELYGDCFFDGWQDTEFCDGEE